MECIALLWKVFPYLKPLLRQLLPYEIRVEELAQGVKKLRKEKSKVQHKVQKEENRIGRTIDDNVIKWLKDVNRVLSDFDKFWEDEDRPYAVCSNGYLPKLAIRYHFSRKVNDIARRVNVLLQSTKNDDFSYWLAPSFNADFDNIRYESFTSRNQTLDDIMAALADSNVGVIGVYGQSGVGKTSLIKQVAKKVKGNMFDVVIMVNLTSLPDIRRIQGQIAHKLGMKWEEESENGRAAQLQKRLKNLKEKTLIILDSIEVKLDFNMLGIPSQNNDSSQMAIEEPLASYKGCKILMISHSKQLLFQQMDGKGIQTFCVEALTEKEAKTMFKTMAEIGDGNSLFESLAAQIAKKSKGLPMIIVAIAKALKNKSLSNWEDAYQELERQNLSTMQEFTVKLSYDLHLLENEELKQTFLICAQMGHDALITDLVRYCIGLGFLQTADTVREARDRVHEMVGKLKELNLLSDSFSSDCFNMQDTIRVTALSMLSQQMNAFALTKGKLHEWPQVDQLESYTAISLQHCDVTDIMEEFPKGISCSGLRIFHLDNEDPHLRIPDKFFDEMKELRVLRLTGVHLTPLPSSIKYLKKLRMLCLERCKLGEHLSIIGDLEELRVLSLSGSDIECLPVESRQLAKLQIFDISNCFNLEEIPAEVLSSLTSLDELCVGNSPIQWKDEGQGNASLSELRQLNQLTSLDIQIPEITNLSKNLFFEKLDTYRIVIGDFIAHPQWDFKVLETHELSRYLVVQVENGFDIHKREDIKVLFEGVEKLLLGQLNDVEDIVKELNFNGFPYLKCLSIARNSKVKCIINSENLTDPPDQRVFPKLESLFLYEVNNMEHICYGQLTNNSFCKLKIIKLKICGQLKNVFFSSMIKLLSALETIEVSECNSLKEIVTMETQSIGYQIEFPELRSLTLKSLPKFIGFYTSTDDTSTGEQMLTSEPDGLFDQKVIVSKLERMELFSMKIHKIWKDDQPLTISYFQNLIHLDVYNCQNLRYLLSMSMSKSLMKLQSLSVSECGMMQSIFVEMEVGMIEIEESIFPNLKNINLRSIEKLKKIWHHKFPLHSFGKLDALIIEECDELENVFPSYIVGRFRSLCNLKVTNCESMEEIFDLKGCGKLEVEDMTSLQNVHVEALPNLKHVWNKDPKGTLNFKSLKKIRFQECHNLHHILPVSVAMGLKKLEYLGVGNCGQLKEIIYTGEAINVSSLLFEFPKLTTARFSKLPNLECFYGGPHELRCSTLNNLTVDHCHKLKLFRTETAYPEIKSISFLPEKVLCNLKFMQIESLDANSLRRCRMHKLEECRLSTLVDTDILYIFLHRNPNLKSLLLSNCLFEQLVPPRRHDEEKLGVVPKLKSLKLMNLPSLKMIGFEEYAVLFRMLECLILNECPCLNIIAPSSVSFTYLTNLEVSNCNKLSYLTTPSTAKSLVRLTTMKVIQCESMKIIVSDSEQESERIIFKELKEIELNALHQLESFCSSDRCDIEFPSLEKIVVTECGNMKRFTISEQVIKTPNLRQKCIRHGKEEKILYWEGDLNATIERMYKIRDREKKQKIVHSMIKESYKNMKKLMKMKTKPRTTPTEEFFEALNNSFGNVDLQKERVCNLVTLTLDNCTLPYAIPSSILPCLNKLRELKVWNSNKVEVIFEMDGIEIMETTSNLKKLSLNRLWKLKRVWEKYGEGAVIFRNLQEVFVDSCTDLQTLFPDNLARNLEELEKLKIQSCDKLKEIVEKKESTAPETTEKFVFPRLEILYLYDLPQLTCFYPQNFTLECPHLKRLYVSNCDKLELFQSPHSKLVESRGSAIINNQSLISNLKVISSLKELILDWKHNLALSSRFKSEQFMDDLGYLEKFSLLCDSYVNEKVMLPVEILQKATNLTEMSIEYYNSSEIFLAENPKIGEGGILGQLRILTLRGISALQSIESEKSSWLNTICDKLHQLIVTGCPHLATLVHTDTVSFSCLKKLSIISCPKLQHLFTSSAAKQLMNLEEITVRDCKSVKEIVDKEGDATSETIKFERLSTITLQSLPSLICFYSGNNILQLSSLKKISLWKCPNIKYFSQGVIHAESFQGIQVSLWYSEEYFLLHQDLNDTIKAIQHRKYDFVRQ